MSTQYGYGFKATECRNLALKKKKVYEFERVAKNALLMHIIDGAHIKLKHYSFFKKKEVNKNIYIRSKCQTYCYKNTAYVETFHH